MTTAVFGFEGTGSQDWSQTDLRRAFVHKFVNTTLGEHRYYYLGADDAGNNSEIVIKRALGRAAECVAQHGVTQILVAGYSRGGMFAIVFADMMKYLFPKVTIPVMVLFDPVDRNLIPMKGIKLPSRPNAPEFQSQTVTNNVKFLIRAFRDPTCGSRSYMDNCGLWTESGINVVSQSFSCSHAGAGGVPWDDAFFENRNLLEAAAAGDPAAIQNQVMSMGMHYRGKSKLATFDAIATLDEKMDRTGSSALGSWVWGLLGRRSVLATGTGLPDVLPMQHDAIYTGADTSKTAVIYENTRRR